MIPEPELLDHASHWVHAHPATSALAGGAIVLTVLVVSRAAALALARGRHRRLARHSQVVQLVPPPVVEPGGAVVFWATLAELLTTARRWRWAYGNAHAGLEYRWDGRRLTIVCWVPGTIPASLVAAAARAAWPGTSTEITRSGAPMPERGRRGVAEGGALVPLLPAGHPLRGDHDVDPLRPLLQAASGLAAGEHACVQILARPAAPHQAARMRTRAMRMRSGGSPGVGFAGGVEATATAAVRAALDLASPRAARGRAAPASAANRTTDPVRDRDARTTADAATTVLWETAIRYGVVHTNPRNADPDQLRARAVTRANGIASAFGVHTARNRLRRVRVHDPVRLLAERQLRRGFLLPAAELAAVATLPTDVAVPGLDRAGAKPVPAPITVPTGGRGTKALGLAQVGGHAVALPVADARHHLHVLGATGTGKSTFLTHLILDDIANRCGVVVIDPKGDLAADVLARLPLTVADRLVVIDPDQPNPARLNPLAGADHDLVVDNIVGIFSRIFARHWGPRIDDVLRVACLTLMRHRDATLALVPPLLNSKQFRAPFVVDLDDPEGLAGFWEWYDTSPASLRAQVIAPVLARLRAFLLRDFVMATIAVPQSSFDMAKVLDGGVLIARLPKGQLGEDTARLMGSFVLASVWQAATARTRQPESRRRDASVYIDEAHNVLNLAGSVTDMLAEARGYRLSLVLAHQDLAQFPRETVLALSANARNKVYFTCSPEDAHALARHTLPELDEHDLANLDAYTAAARLVVDARATRAFTLTTRPPKPPLDHTEALRALVAERTPALPSTSASQRRLAGAGSAPRPPTG